MWSGRLDLNQRVPGLQSGALGQTWRRPRLCVSRLDYHAIGRNTGATGSQSRIYAQFSAGIVVLGGDSATPTSAGRDPALVMPVGLEPTTSALRGR